MIGTIRPRTFQRTAWIAILQYLFLLDYLLPSYELMHIGILIFSGIVLMAETVDRIHKGESKIAMCLFVAWCGSAWSFLCTIVNGSGFGSAVTQLILLVSVSLISNMSLSHNEWKRIVLRMTIILFVILVVYSGTTLYRAYYIPILPFMPKSAQINPNCIAILSYYCTFFGFCIIEYEVKNKIVRRLLQCVILMIGAWYIFLSAARTSMVAIVIFVILFSTCKYKRAGMVRKVYFVGLCLSLLVIFVYISLYHSNIAFEGLIGGKTFFSGRQGIWAEALNLIKDNPIFGFSNKTSFGAGSVLSAHNSLLAILCYFGIPGLVSSVFVIYKSFKVINYKENRLMVSSIFSLLMVMSFETLLTDWSLMMPFSILFLQLKNEE